jgi:D-alanyl-lipoteichoic acid acyltransferase DltB (MBOAT superfamily)
MILNQLDEIGVEYSYMLFNSYTFILLFLPIVLIGYFFLTKKRLIVISKIWLILASLFFYGYWNPKYLPLLLLSIMLNFAVGSGLCNTQFKQKVHKKTILAIGIVLNLATLGYFKYMDFFIENVNNIFNLSLPMLKIVLPLAISFFTFTQIVYLIDSYKNETKESDFLNYMLFVTFFPHLIAGPIVYHKDLMPQFDILKNKVLNHKNIILGLFLFLIGLFKKVVLADTFSIYANIGFNPESHLSLIEGWITCLSYTFQIYFDFSGYCDMALGSSKMFNIDLPINFNSPYKAISIQDFWRRWHITLSRFLRDYVYIPFGGSRAGEFNTYRNLFLTFLIGGIWHGASWMFVIWGALHGLALCVHRFWDKFKIKMPQWLAIFTTFMFVNITWVFFRAENLDIAKKVLFAMFDFSHILIPRIYRLTFKFKEAGEITNTFENALLMFILVGIILFMKNSNQLLEYIRIKNTKEAIAYGFAFVVVFVGILMKMGIIPYTEFIYFNF